MLWTPGLKPLVVQAAVRELPVPVTATAPQPVIVVPPSVKFTAPVGATPLTVAVRVRLVPAVDGLWELTKVVVEPGLLTTCDSGALLDAAFALSPP
jgi:hypothetical protein